MVREPFYVGRLVVYGQGMGAHKCNVIVEINIFMGAYLVWVPIILILWYYDMLPSK